MSSFVFWTGIYNILLGSSFLSQPLVEALGVDAPDSAFWIRFPATLVIFLGVLLVLCSRDLSTRGSIVYWEGLLRIAAAIVVAGYGYSDHLGLILIVLGCIDFVIGVVYLVGLPSALKMSPKELLFDMRSAAIGQ